MFELASGSAVCGFEAFIKNKHVIGKVEEKQQAHKKYKRAVEDGKRAYLLFRSIFSFLCISFLHFKTLEYHRFMLDESEEEANVFTISVGNIPGRCDVIIKITYLTLN